MLVCARARRWAKSGENVMLTVGVRFSGNILRFEPSNHGRFSRYRKELSYVLTQTHHRTRSRIFPLSGSTACSCPEEASQIGKGESFPELKYEKYRLPNGLEVILSEDHRLPLVAVNLWYHVGAANESQGRTGFAHLFEHMMFEGSKHVGARRTSSTSKAAGASDINGTTEFDRTNYFETLPSNQLELALWLESDRMGYLLDTLDHEKLANQRDVVRNERRQSIENAPYGLVDEEIYHQLFPKGHPYYADVIGSHDDIEAAQLG